MCDGCGSSGICPDRRRAEEAARDRALAEAEGTRTEALRQAIAAEPAALTVTGLIRLHVLAVGSRPSLLAAAAEEWPPPLSTSLLELEQQKER